MLTEPDGLGADVLASALAREWQLAAASITHRPVGFGSHHWAVTDESGTRWFATADELEVKRLSLSEPLDAVFARLSAALGAAMDLRAHGRDFVVAPVPTVSGGPLARQGERFSIALYPFVDGTSFEWGDFGAPGHRLAIVKLLVGVHTAPPAAVRRALADDFTIPHRDELEAALDPFGGAPQDLGPFARPLAALLAANAEPIRRQLGRYDELAVRTRSAGGPVVLTHGEPHPGNTMLTADGWRLIDWDTALIARPERDLWDLDPGDGSVLAAYADAIGIAPSTAALDLYRLRWDLADLAVGVSRLRARHAGSADDRKSWNLLRSLVERMARW
ncbi:MAG TPA: phosphotransferase [Streptosporangiaceae bacterium]|nr:phosphotransferase [Streptosporangiaceae bacterium]